MKRFFLLSLSFILLVSALCLPACAAGKLTLSVGSVSGAVGDTVKLSVTVKSNPGIIATKISAEYDTSVLELQGAENGEVFADSNAVFGNKTSVSPYVMLWEDSLAPKNNTKTGVLVTLSFKIRSGAQAGKTAVSVTVDGGSTFDFDLESVPFESSGGTVTVTSSGQGGKVTTTQGGKVTTTQGGKVTTTQSGKVTTTQGGKVTTTQGDKTTVAQSGSETTIQSEGESASQSVTEITRQQNDTVDIPDNSDELSGTSESASAAADSDSVGSNEYIKMIAIAIAVLAVVAGVAVIVIKKKKIIK